jgi:hypothetical protein
MAKRPPPSPDGRPPRREFGRRGVAPPPVLQESAPPEAPGRRRIRRIALGVTAATAISAYAWDGGWFSTRPACDPSDPMAAAEPECRDRKDQQSASSSRSSGGGHWHFWNWSSGSSSTTTHASAATPTSAVHFGGFGKTGAAFHGGGA